MSSYPNIGSAILLALWLLQITFYKKEFTQIGQEPLSKLAILSIKYDIAKSIAVDHTIDKLVSEKAGFHIY